MTERQYRQVIKNRRLYTLEPLLGGHSAVRVLREADRDLRRRRVAERSLARELTPEQLARARVVSLRDDLLVLQVDDPVSAERLRRGSVRLVRALSRRMGGIRRLRVVTGAAELDVEGTASEQENGA